MLIHHMDLYRLGKGSDFNALLDMENVLADSICLLEWPDRLGSMVPSQRLDVDVRIASGAADARSVALTPYGSLWEARVRNIALGSHGLEVLHNSLGCEDQDT